MIFDITDILSNVTWDSGTKSSDCDCDDCDGKLKVFDRKFRFFYYSSISSYYEGRWSM